MTRVKFFWKPDCPTCPTAKKLLEDCKSAEYYNIEEKKGLSEAIFYNVEIVPTIVLTDDQGREIESWRGKLPPPDIIAKWT